MCMYNRKSLKVVQEYIPSGNHVIIMQAELRTRYLRQEGRKLSRDGTLSGCLAEVRRAIN